MLQKFGFSQYESQAYEVVVSSNEPLDATTIVKHSGVPKAKIYEILARLIDKGMVMDSVSEKKKLYTALPLKLAIEKLTAEFQTNIKELETNISKKSFIDDRVWSLKMQSSIQVQSKQIIEDAKKSIRISAWNDTFLEYLPLLEQKAQQGVEIEGLIVGKAETELKNIHFLIPTEEPNALERYLLLIVDDHEILFAGVEQESWQAMKTMSQPFVKFFTEFFYHDVALAKITQKHHELFMNDEEIRSILMKLRY
ncbi:TrmB family transcriptional regulator [Bacillus cytotoxicus]|uniref:TrmB family transcriptional regulator n=1 Tax=unclassified Bacillus cereus group TaxID=2750818 RepID=UPI001F58663B|nr:MULTISPECIES: TrmB family transcriptional regulator [unclassified Bacillus cereus group]EMA6342363.1 TrmB family transcriptional regulator [Bacillus cytotoxicus]